MTKELTSKRITAVRDAKRGFWNFLTHAESAKRRKQPGALDFSLGNPHEMPPAGYAETLKNWTEPQHPQRHVAFMSLVEIRLKIAKPLPYSTTPRTLEEHIRKRRCELALLQKEVAPLLKVDPWTICDWEKDGTHLPVRYRGRIIDFLAYDPFPAPRSLPERIVARHQRLCLSQKQLAKRLGVDEGTLDNPCPAPAHLSSA